MCLRVGVGVDSVTLMYMLCTLRLPEELLSKIDEFLVGRSSLLGINRKINVSMDSIVGLVLFPPILAML